MALVGAAVVGVTALSLAKVNSISINAMKANSVALQAYQFADAEAQLVRAIDYSSLASKAKSDIPNSNGFQREITLSAESNYSDSIKQKTATVKIYKTGESTPIISLDVKRLSKEVSASSVPSGTILPWYGALGNIPVGYALCNGSNGTPDLRNRFLVGAGSDYNLGNTGGANNVTLTTAQMPSHTHTGSTSTDGVHSHNIYYHCGTDDLHHTIEIGDSNWGRWGFSNSLISSSGAHSHTMNLNNTGGNQAHENRPPYYAVYYIMKL